MRSDRSLYDRLNEFALDDESAAFTFSDRLARENGWSLAFAKAAIAEYKKFIYLAAISPTPITPSDIIDQVWHLHLTYSRSYWDEMCGRILGKPLHHGPTKGGEREDAKYRQCYADTREAYAREFGAEPPAAFWPPSDARFESASHQRWVDTRSHAVIAWRTISRAAAIGFGTFVLTSAGVAFAAAKGSAGNTKLFTELGIFAAIAAAFYLTNRFVRRKKDGKNEDYGSGAGSWIGGGGGNGGSGQHGNVGSHGGHDVSGGGGGSDGGGSGCSSGCGGGGCSS